MPVDQAVNKWLDLISQSREREKNWRKDARHALKIYRGDMKDQIPFNVLFSNTETLLPALYSSQPRPLVTRRFKTSDDPIGLLAARSGQRMLEHLTDPNDQTYEHFSEVMEDCVLDALVPGRGVPRFRYDAAILGEEGQRYVQGETVCGESVAWDRIVIGRAKKWSKVPWVAFYHEIDAEEAKKKFGATVAAKINYSNVANALDEEDKDRKDRELEKDLARVWEIWDKEARVVRWISPDYNEGELKKPDPDPLELTGFFPMPQPLRFLRKSNDLLPGTIYRLYENQAAELNRITVRINRVVEALKVRGAYDSSIPELEKVTNADDNTLVAAENVSALYDKGGLEKALWLMPIEKLVNVLQQLYLARENCKRTIYEITGIADIIRGQSVASETLGAQKIKENWATLRLKRMQRDVQRFVRECLRIMLEIAASKFGEDTFASMTGMPIATEVQKQQQLTQMRMAATAGQPVTPEQIQAIQSQPTWKEIIQILRDDTARKYRIDIETNSTVEADATEDKQDIANMLGALSQYLSGVGPLVQSGVLPFEAAQAMMLAITRRFNFGQEVEEHVRAMQPPRPQDDGKQEAAVKEKEAAAQETSKLQQENAQLKLQLQQEKAEREFSKREAQLNVREQAITTKESVAQGLQDRGVVEIASQSAVQAVDAVAQQVARIEQAVLATRNHSAATALTLQQFMSNTQQLLAGLVQQHRTLLELAAMPKKQEAIRGADGKIETVITTPVGGVDLSGKSIEELLQMIASPREKKVGRGKDGRVTQIVTRGM